MSANIVDLNQDTFKQTIETSESTVLVDFWAPWCGPCRAQTPELETFAAAIGSKVKVAKINVDDVPEVAQNYGVMSIPTLIAFYHGQPVKQWVGVQSHKTLLKELS